MGPPRSRALRSALSTLAAGAILAGLAGGCSAKHDPAGGILLAVDTNLKVPDDIDAIGISVTSAEDGAVTEDDMFPLAPGGMAKFPATLAILHGTDKPLQIRAVGYKDGAAIAMRQAVTTLPADRVALLSFELNWLDKSLVSGTTSEMVRSVTTSCSSSQTPLAGTCTSFQLDSATLGTYAQAALAPSDGAATVDCDTCFAGAQPVTVDETSCTFTPPAGVSDATAINVVFQLAAGHTAGWCNGSSCIIPLPHDPLEGWSLRSDGLIHLPPAACTNAAVGSVLVAPATASCPVLSSDHPAKQDYGTESGDATVPDDSGSRPDAGAEAGPTFPAADFALAPLTNVMSLATDGTALYALARFADGTGVDVEQLPLDFADNATATTAVTYPFAADTPPVGSIVSSAVGSGYYAYGFSASGRAVVPIFPLAEPDSGVPFTFNEAGALFDMDLALSDPSTLALSFIGPYGAEAERVSPISPPSAAVYGMALHRAANIVASGRYTPNDGGAARYVFGDSTGQVTTADAYSDAGVLYGSNTPPDTPYEFAYAGGSLHMIDTAGQVSQIAVAKFPTPARLGASALTGNAAMLAWIAASDGTVHGAVPDAGVFGEQPGALALLPDGGAPGGIGEVIFAGDSLYWFDAQGVHRTLASILVQPAR